MTGTSSRLWLDAGHGAHQGPVVEAVDGYHVIDCEACRFKHVVPLPVQGQLQDVYEQDYYSTEKPFYIEQYQTDRDWWNAVYAQRYEFLERQLPPSRRRLLDVGSGPGLFLAHGRDRGWQTKGIEPSRQAAAYSQSQLGLDVLHAFLDRQTASGLGKFDAINMGEVLEHLPEPAQMLSLAHELLEEDGLLCLIVPNDFNPFQTLLNRRLGFRPWWVAPPHHLNYFDQGSLAELVERCGFAILRQETTFPIDMFLLMGENYIDDPQLGRTCHRRRMKFEQNLLEQGGGDLLGSLYQAFARLNLGREIVLFARRSAHADALPPARGDAGHRRPPP